MSKSDRAFYPPRQKVPLVRLAQIMAPFWAYFYQRLRLEIDVESLKILASLDQERSLLLPNHPTFQDPVVTFMLSGLTGKPYYYLSAYDLFKSPLAGFFQSLGVYSIRRGLADRPSIAQTLDLLSQPRLHLVIFPEGGCSFQNDTVMPFRAGAVQLAFQALSRFAKQGETVPNLYLVPIAIKYRYPHNMSRVIQQTLARLEAALQISPPASASNYERLRVIAQQVLMKVEQDYDLYSLEVAQQPWNERIARLREQVLERCEQALQVPAIKSEPVRERAYRLEFALKQREEALETEATLLENRQAAERLYDYRLLEKSVRRLLNFDAIYDGYVAENPTPERFLDTLVRLEREVFEINQPPPKSFRFAQVKVGEPLNLKDWFETYQRNRVQTVNTLTQTLQQTVQAKLDWLNQQAR